MAAFKKSSLACWSEPCTEGSALFGAASVSSVVEEVVVVAVVLELPAVEPSRRGRRTRRLIEPTKRRQSCVVVVEEADGDGGTAAGKLSGLSVRAIIVLPRGPSEEKK